jgi:hypothetical protein
MALEWLKKVNDFLEQVPLQVTEWFEHTFKSGEKLTQDFVDRQCAWLAWKINIMVERKRQEVLKTLHDEYGGYLGALQVVTVFKQAVTDPIGTLGSVFNTIAGPYAKVVDFLKTLMKEIPRLAANLAKIASSLPPAPPNPRINFNAFKLNIKSISMADVINGGSLPTPEQMFPEPPKPFGKASFDSSFENAPIAKGINEVIYKEGETPSNIVDTQSIMDIDVSDISNIN